MKRACPSPCRELREARRLAERFRRSNARLRARNRRLREKLAEARRAARRQAAPFSKGEPGKNPKRPGRKPGKAYGRRAFRPIPDRVDETCEAPLPPLCPDCQGELEETGVEPQYQTDIPEVKPKTRRFRVHVGRCKRCGRRVQGRHRLQTSDALGAAGVQVGPRALALAAHMNKELGVPYGKIARFFRTASLIDAARSTLCRALLRLARKAGPTYRALVPAVRGSLVVYADETGWKIGGRRAWLWAFVTMRLAVYLIRRSRGGDVVEEALGLDFAGVLGRDGWGAYRVLVRCRHQTCLTHLLRRSAEMHEVAVAGQARLPLAVKRLLRDALDLRDRRGRMSPHSFAVARGRIEARADRLIRGRYTHEPNARFVRHLARERDALFTFLHEPEVEAANWPGEQAIRPAVVNRKTSGGSRTDAGAEAQAILMSVVRTARMQGREPVALLVMLLRAPHPVDLGLANPTEKPHPPQILLPLPRAQPA